MEMTSFVTDKKTFVQKIEVRTPYSEVISVGGRNQVINIYLFFKNARKIISQIQSDYSKNGQDLDIFSFNTLKLLTYNYRSQKEIAL